METIVKRLGYTSRNTFYYHTKQAALSLLILEKYGKVIRHNFADEIPEMESPVLKELDSEYLTRPETIEEAIRQRDFYFKQYLKLLEDIRRLEEEKLRAGTGGR